MQIKHLTQFTTTAWSGGTTTELYIYPEDSQYKSLDFLFRLSKATIEVEESTFTPLPQVKRCLMLLEGNLQLLHEGQSPKTLSPFESAMFTGDWATKSIGKATDLNLMCRNEANGLLKKRVMRRLNARSFWQENDLSTYRAVLYYMHEGKVEIKVGETLYTLEQGEVLVVLPEGEHPNLRIHLLERSVWIGAYIN